MDGFGYAVFGHIVSGLSILQGIHEQPTLVDAPQPLIRGQLLAEPVGFSVRS